MQTDKFSLFDVLTFIIPGSTLLYVLYFFGKPHFPIHEHFPTTNSNYLLIPYAFASYIAGHALSWLGRKLEDLRMKLFSYPCLTFLRASPIDAQKLDELNQQIFKESFFDENKIIENKADRFYTNAYNYLFGLQKTSKIDALMAQYTFFRSAITLGFVTIVLACCFPTLPLLRWGFVLYLVSTYILLLDREQILMNLTYRTFLIENVLPKKPDGK